MLRDRFLRSLVIFIVVYCLALAAVLIVGARGTRYSGAPAVGTANRFASQGASLSWPADPPVPWPGPTSASEARTLLYVLRDVRSGDQSQTTHSMQVEEFGWPFPAFQRVRLWWPWNDPQYATSVSPDSGLRVIWGNVLGMPAFAAAIVAILLLAPPLLRETRRRGRGLCPRCAYDLRGDLAGGCSECGWRRPV